MLLGELANPYRLAALRCEVAPILRVRLSDLCRTWTDGQDARHIQPGLHHVTLARSRGNTFNFKSTQALESFRNRAAANLARQGYRIGEDTKSPAAASNFGLDRAERKSEVLPLYQKVEGMADMRTLRTEVSGKTRGNLFDQYSLSGITRKFTKG